MSSNPSTTQKKWRTGRREGMREGRREGGRENIYTYENLFCCQPMQNRVGK
jgi:hypothetical protein